MEGSKLKFGFTNVVTNVGGMVGLNEWCCGTGNVNKLDRWFTIAVIYASAIIDIREVVKVRTSVVFFWNTQVL